MSWKRFLLARIRALPWWGWASLAVVILFVLAAAGGWLVVHRYGPALAHERIEAALAAALDRPVRIGGVVLRPWLARVEIHRVAVASGPAWSDGSLLDVEQVTVHAGLASLWRGELVSRIVLDGAQLRATAGGGGALDLPPSIPERFTAGPVTIAVRAVDVRRGRVVVRDAAGPRQIVADDVKLTATPSEGGVNVVVSAGTLAVTAPGLDETAETLWASLQLRGDRLAIERLRARWRDQPIGVAGEVRGLAADATLALTVDGAVSARWLASRLGDAWPAEGLITAHAVLEGPAAAPTAAAQVEVAELRAGPVEARAVSAELAWREGTLRVTDARASTLGGRVAGAVTWSPREPAATVAEIQLDGVTLDALETLASASLGLRGRITARGELRGDPADWKLIGQSAGERRSHVGRTEGRLRVTEAQVTLPGEAARLGTGTLRGEVRVAGAGIEIVHADARWLAIHVGTLTGRLDARGPTGMKAVVTGDVGRLSRLFGGTRVEGTATMTAELGGRWNDLRIAGEARAPQLVVDDARLTDVGVDFSVTGRTARIAAATATIGGTRAAVSGVLRLPDGAAVDAVTLRERLEIAGDVRVPSARLEDLAPWLPADWRGRGAFALTARVEGAAAAWRARGTVTGGPLAVRGERVESLDARFDATPQRVDVPRLAARVRDVPLRLSATWARDDGATVRGDAGPITLATIPGVPANAELAGTATARGQGQWRDGRWSGSATIDGRDVRAAGVRLGHGAVVVTVRDGVAAADVRFPEARVTAQVKTTLGSDAPASVRVAFAGFDLAPVLARLPAIPAPVAPVRGAVSGTADLVVPLAAPVETRGTLRLEAIRVVAAGETWETTAPAVIHREPGLTRIERLALRVATGTPTAAADQTLRASGSITDDAALSLAVEGRVSLASLARLRPEVREAAGVLEATLTVAGTGAAVEARGQARVRDARVLLRDLPHPVTDMEADLALAPGRVRVTSSRASVLGSAISMSGDLTLAPLGLDLAVRGDVPLGALAGLRPEITDARGTLRLDARVAGTPSRPEATGDATLRADYLALRDYPTPLRDVRARLTASPARLSVTDASATVGGGTVRARGDVTVRDLVPGPYAFTVEARHVLLEPSPDFTTVWDADLELVGAGGRARLQGQARLVRGAWVRDTPLLRSLLEPRGGGRAASGDGAGLAIRLDLGENLVIRTAVARFRARGTLDLQGTTGQPIVFGTVEAVDGHVLFRGHRFALARASARFLDPRRIDPALDVLGTTRIGSYDVRLQVNGRIEELEVRLASSPPLPEEDLLSLVAFGATRAELGKRGAGAVAGEVAGLILKDLFGIGGEGLGPVDTVEIKSADASGRTVELGKRVGDRATLRYSQGVDDSTERRLRVEYEVIGPVLIAGEQDFRGGFGADVLVRFRFR